MTTGEKIRSARLKRKLTLADVGDRCGMTKQQLAAWEGDINDIRLGSLEKVAAALKMTASQLLAEEDEPATK